MSKTHQDRPPVQIGIVGCGWRIRGVARQILDARPGIGVRSLYDISQVSLDDCRERFPGARAVACYKEMLEDPEISWVFVGSFNAAHRDHAVQALEAGKHVFCEKPLATTLADCMAIRDAVHVSGRTFAIGFVLRYSPFYRKVKELLDAGALGDIVSFEFNETIHPNHGAAMHGNWRRSTKNGGTSLLEKCCHDMDSVNWLLGSRARRVASFGGTNFFRPDQAHHIERLGVNEQGVPFYLHGLQTGHYVGLQDNVNPFTDDKDVVDNQVAIIEYENDVRATFHLNMHAAILERRLYLLGTEGALRGDLITGQVEVCRTGWDAQSEYTDTTTRGGHGGGDEVMGDELAACLTEGVVPMAGITDGLLSAVTCFGIDRAMEEGRVVEMEPLWSAVGL